MTRSSLFLARLLAVAILVLLPGRQAWGQGLEAGGRIGPVYSTVATEGEADPPDLSWRLGYEGGGFLSWPLGGFALQFEGLYTQRGASVDEEGIDAQLIIDYLQVPVLAKVSRGGLYFAGGPAFGFRLRARSRADFGGATEEIDVSDDIKHSDLAIVGAVGFGRGRLVLDGRYVHGVVDIDRDRTDQVTIFNRAFSATFGIRF